MTRIVLAMMLASPALPGAEPGFVRIPAGAFTMGCEPENACPERQKPREVVFERDFWMQRTEVTVADFRKFVESTGYRTQAEESAQPWTWRRPRAFKLEGRQPVVYVTLRDAEAYCAWRGGRVPTEPEWTYAFRAAETVRGRLWWDRDDRYVWHRENSAARPRRVGTKLPNAWGLYDMEGNAWEWTRTAAGEKYPAAIRGGSWVVCPPEKPFRWGFFTRCPSDGAVHIRDDVGFRCVRTAP